ncbi:MAG: metallophosphoesterase [Hyphomonadaceae bacterium]
MTRTPRSTSWSSAIGANTRAGRSPCLKRWRTSPMRLAATSSSPPETISIRAASNPSPIRSGRRHSKPPSPRRRLQTPWYAVLGNHDYRGSVDAELDYTIASPRWQMPSRYWRSDMDLGAETASFFFLDTFPLTHLPMLRARVPMLGDRDEAQEQLRWLERALAASNARWKIAVGHHPILSSGSHGGSETLYDHVRPLLERYGVRAYFNGHDHNLEYLSDGGVSYICSGAGSEAREVRAPLEQTRFAYGRGPGFVSCRLNSETLVVRFHDATGAVLYRTEIASTSA